MQKYIVCGKCRYFPNKADQVKSLQVKINTNNIQWYCTICHTLNRYPNRQAVMLPESSFVQFNKDSLLRNQCDNSVKNIIIVIDFNNIKASMCYIPSFKEQISKLCGTDIQNLKDVDIMQSQSSWFAKYRQILKSFTKFLAQQSRKCQQNSQAGYLIYLIHCYISSLAKQEGSKIKLSIFLLQKHNVYYFDIDEVDKLSKNIISCLQIYSLFQINDKIPWLLSLYSKELNEYKIEKKAQGRVDKLVLIGDHYEMNQESIRNVLTKINNDLSISQLLFHENVVILKFIYQNPASNIYQINPFSKQSFINYIKNHSDIQKGCQQTIIYFRTKKSKQIALYKLKAPQIQKVKELMLNKPISQASLKETCKQLMQDNKEHHKIKLIKIYCAFNVSNRIQIILYTFNWHKLQKELLFEELDQEILQQHQLKEDILNEDIIKLNNPSPFIKKNIYLKVQDQHQTNQDDCQYL